MMESSCRHHRAPRRGSAHRQFKGAANTNQKFIDDSDDGQKPTGSGNQSAFARANLSKLCQKTRLCSFHGNGVNCPYGVTCTFAHGENELRSSPNLQYTKLCASLFGKGKCPGPGRCKFAHDQHEVRAVSHVRHQNNVIDGFQRFAHDENKVRPRSTKSSGNTSPVSETRAPSEEENSSGTSPMLHWLFQLIAAMTFAPSHDDCHLLSTLHKASTAGALEKDDMSRHLACVFADAHSAFPSLALNKLSPALLASTTVDRIWVAAGHDGEKRLTFKEMVHQCLDQQHAPRKEAFNERLSSRSATPPLDPLHEEGDALTNAQSDKIDPESEEGSKGSTTEGDFDESVSVCASWRSPSFEEPRGTNIHSSLQTTQGGAQQPDEPSSVLVRVHKTFFHFDESDEDICGNKSRRPRSVPAGDRFF
eukprot:TRINITY_DN68108_c0_g1_i1.p1 TRINITY_DN68108_c0_g1~~TRINITY_DN68108_c0_g1_i1.p1  ORF type:complete len:420 (-),score=51.42 TRINITY_DN68108_c0_g1_i1:157-1416(-)